MTEVLHQRERRICVCGGREFNNKDFIYNTLDRLLTTATWDFTIINGAASGADSLSSLWAKDRNVRLEEYPANWKKHGKAAGPIRNRYMIFLGIDMLIAFPGGTGTNDMINACRKENIFVWKPAIDNWR